MPLLCFPEPITLLSNASSCIPRHSACRDSLAEGPGNSPVTRLLSTIFPLFQQPLCCSSFIPYSATSIGLHDPGALVKAQRCSISVPTLAVSSANNFAFRQSIRCHLGCLTVNTHVFFAKVLPTSGFTLHLRAALPLSASEKEGFEHPALQFAERSFPFGFLFVLRTRAVSQQVLHDRKTGGYFICRG